VSGVVLKVRKATDTGADPPPSTVVEPLLDDPFPDYDTEPVMMYANG
jgi:hypothetical protein